MKIDENVAYPDILAEALLDARGGGRSDEEPPLRVPRVVEVLSSHPPRGVRRKWRGVEGEMLIG